MTPPDHDHQEALFNNDLPLPDELSWNNMETGILEKVAAIERRRKRKRRFIFWLFPLLLLGISGLGYWLTFDHSDTANPTITASEATSPKDLDNHQLTEASHPTTNNTATNDPSETSAINNNQSTISTDEVAVLSGTQQPTTQTIITPAENDIEIQFPLRKSQDQFPISSSKDQTETIDAETYVQEVKVPQLNLAVTTSDDTEIDRVLFATSPYVLPLTYQLDLPERLLNIDDVVTGEVLREETTSNFKGSSRILVNGGINWLNSRYTGASDDLVMLRTASEFTDPGTQAAVQFERTLSPHFFMGSGVAYKTYRTLLDTDAESTFERLNTMVLLRFNQDPVTMDTNNLVFGDTMVAVTQLRRIKHYNRYTSLEVPLYLGYGVEFGKFNVSILAGFTASFSRNIEGRIFDGNGSVANIGEEQFIKYRNGLALSTAAGLRLGYQLTPSWQMTLGSRYQSFFSNWMSSSSTALESRPGVWSVDIGGAFSF